MARSRGFGTKSDSRCRNPRVSVGELSASPSLPTGDRLTELAISRRASIFAGVDQPVNLGETTRAVGAQLTGSAVHDNLTWPLPALGVAGLGNVTLPASTTAGFATLAPPPPLPLPTTLPGPLPPPPPPAPSAPPLVPPVPNDVFENLAGCHMRNADRIHPEWQQRDRRHGADASVGWHQAQPFRTQPLVRAARLVLRARTLTRWTDAAVCPKPDPTRRRESRLRPVHRTSAFRDGAQDDAHHQAAGRRGPRSSRWQRAYTMRNRLT